jgi:iron-sulfur cluster repair protein YtfE (RIC family)
LDLTATLDSVTSTYHALLQSELPALDAALAGTPPVLSHPWRELSSLLRDHVAKEEQLLFPMVRSLARGGIPDGVGLEGLVRQMNFEHACVKPLAAQVRANADLAGAAQDRLVAVLDGLAELVALEDDGVFPAVLALAATMSEG